MPSIEFEMLIALLKTVINLIFPIQHLSDVFLIVAK